VPITASWFIRISRTIGQLITNEADVSFCIQLFRCRYSFTRVLPEVQYKLVGIFIVESPTKWN